MRLVVTTLLLLSFISRSEQATNAKTLDINCMFLGYPELEYDGFDRTEVGLTLNSLRFVKCIAKARYHPSPLPFSVPIPDCRLLSDLFLPFRFPLSFLPFLFSP